MREVNGRHFCTRRRRQQATGAHRVIRPWLHETTDKDFLLLVFAKDDDLRRPHAVQPRAWTSDMGSPVSFLGSTMRVWL